ncbi:MAG: hypothetical protein WBR15_02385 [Gammaproteobacteria bacterium]
MYIIWRYMPLLLAAPMFISMAGCVPHAARPDVVVVPETSEDQIAQVLDYVSIISNEPPAAQAAAQEKLAVQLKLTQFPEDRMRLALLDALLPAPARNDGHATMLLSGYNWEAVGPGFKGLAVLVLSVLKARQIDASNYQALTEQLTSERTQKAHLQQQLDALKSIEKTMNSRDKPVVTSPAANSHAPATPPSEP